MNFLLDTDTCSAHLKRPAGLMHRFVQHADGLCIATIVFCELYTWASNRKNWAEAVQRIENDLLPDVIVLAFDSAWAKQFGIVGAQLLQVGISVSRWLFDRGFFADDPTAQTTRVSASCECLAGRITISTSRPKAFRNRNSRSVENPSSLPRRSAETLGWSIPRSFAARVCVSFRSAMMSAIRCTSSAFARSSSGFLSPRSANAFPLDRSMGTGSSPFFFRSSFLMGSPVGHTLGTSPMWSCVLAYVSVRMIVISRSSPAWP